MSSLVRQCRFSCTAAALIASLIVGIFAAFLQITAVITVTPVFLWVTFGIAAGYLGLLAAGAIISRRIIPENCADDSLNALLIGILGTVLLSLILLAVGITATSVVSAVLTGLLLFFFSLTLTATACFIRCLLTTID